MLEQLFSMLMEVATSSHAAIFLSLAFNMALGYGWWRREQGHLIRYDKLREDWIAREAAYLECLTEHDDTVAALGTEAFSVVKDVAGALTGMERTLEGLEMLVRRAGNERGRIEGEGND